MLPVASSTWSAGYKYRPFRMESTEIDFQYSRSAAVANTVICKGSNISAVWIPCHQETLINGVLQGRKQNDQRGASALSRMQTWELVIEIVGLLDVHAQTNILKKLSYLDMKRSQNLEQRRHVKEEVKSEALKGWDSR